MKNIYIANELAFFTYLLYIFFTLPILPMSSAKPSVKVMLPQEMQMLLFVWNALTTYTSLNCFRKDEKSSERQKAVAVAEEFLNGVVKTCCQKRFKNFKRKIYEKSYSSKYVLYFDSIFSKCRHGFRQTLRVQCCIFSMTEK